MFECPVQSLPLQGKDVVCAHDAGRVRSDPPRTIPHGDRNVVEGARRHPQETLSAVVPFSIELVRPAAAPTAIAAVGEIVNTIACVQREAAIYTIAHESAVVAVPVAVKETVRNQPVGAQSSTAGGGGPCHLVPPPLELSAHASREVGPDGLGADS